MAARFPMAVVVTGAPLTITVEGASAVVAAEDFVGGLATDDRVQAAFLGDRLTVLAKAGGNGPNPNLLINSDFVVNQRGAVSGTSVVADAYFLDRWKNLSTGARGFSWADVGGVRTLTIGSASVSAEVGQIIEAANLPSGVHTVSTDAVGASLNVYNAAGTVVASGVGTTKPTVSFTADGTQDYSARLLTDAGTTATVSWMKVERGAVATPYQPPTFDDNLRACRRFYVRYTARGQYTRFAAGFGKDSTRIKVLIGIPVMRSEVTMTTSGDLRTYDETTIGAISSMNINQQGEMVTLELVVTGATAFRPYVLIAGGETSFIAFDAEL